MMAEQQDARVAGAHVQRGVRERGRDTGRVQVQTCSGKVLDFYSFEGFEQQYLTYLKRINLPCDSY